MKKFLPAVLGALFLLFCGAGCASPLSEEPVSPGVTLNLSNLENEVGGSDPIEGANRVMFAVTDFCMDYIVDFIGRIYCTILPRPIIDGLDNVCVNLEFPARVISCLLSAEWRGAGDETVRKAYRELAKRYHPDRLRAEGKLEEMIGKATATMAKINGAWDAIKAARKLRK